MGSMVSILVTFSPEKVVLMEMLSIDSDRVSTVVPFGNTLVQVNCGVGSLVAVQLRMAGLGERTSTSMGSPNRVTETADREIKSVNIPYQHLQFNFRNINA